MPGFNIRLSLVPDNPHVTHKEEKKLLEISKRNTIDLTLETEDEQVDLSSNSSDFEEEVKEATEDEKERRLFAFFHREIEESKCLFPEMNDRDALKFVGKQLLELKKFCNSDLMNSPVRRISVPKKSSSTSAAHSGKRRRSSDSKKGNSKRRLRQKKRGSSSRKDVSSTEKRTTPDNEYMMNYTCVFCEDAPREVILTNCKHVVLCFACAETMRNNSPIHVLKCPICRKKNPDFVRCFLS